MAGVDGDSRNTCHQYVIKSVSVDVRLLLQYQCSVPGIVRGTILHPSASARARSRLFSFSPFILYLFYKLYPLRFFFFFFSNDALVYMTKPCWSSGFFFLLYFPLNTARVEIGLQRSRKKLRSDDVTH